MESFSLFDAYDIVLSCISVVSVFFGGLFSVVFYVKSENLRKKHERLLCGHLYYNSYGQQALNKDKIGSYLDYSVAGFVIVIVGFITASVLAEKFLS